MTIIVGIVCFIIGTEVECLFWNKSCAKLRALVKEMADVLNETKNYTCFGCTIRDCPGEHECRYTKKYCLLIAKAREAIGGTE